MYKFSTKDCTLSNYFVLLIEDYHFDISWSLLTNINCVFFKICICFALRMDVLCNHFGFLTNLHIDTLYLYFYPQWNGVLTIALQFLDIQLYFHFVKYNNYYQMN